jgi:hypothetical protein
MAGDRDDDEAAHARALVCYRLIAEATTAPRGARTALLRLAASKEVTFSMSTMPGRFRAWLEHDG